jgi:riboflavin kinase / FMN adenylyltransferase
VRLIRLTEEYIKELVAGRIGLRGPQVESSSLALGSFDGLHRGHQALLSRVKTVATDAKLESGVVFTFLQHPWQLLRPEAEPFLLTTWREKLSRFHESGCRVIVAADFCPALAELTYEEFVRIFLVGYLGMKHLVAGYDLHLGADRGGTAETLGELGRSLDFTLEVVPPVRVDGQIISSSLIRKTVAAGDMPAAAAMLGRPYELWGEVRPGDRRGREIGYPTANIQPLDALKLLPACGVYAVRVQVPGDAVAAGTPGVLNHVNESLPEVDMQGDLLSSALEPWAVFGGMLNFGNVPTFHGNGLPEPRIEVNIFGFEGDLRGRNIKVEWVRHLRPERKFDGADDLVQQLGRDRIEALNVLGLS